MTMVREDSALGAVAMTVDTEYQVFRGLLMNCTGAGVVQLVLRDSSVVPYNVPIGSTILPFAVKQINSSGTTATATYYGLK